jgi:hypothetical protein
LSSQTSLFPESAQMRVSRIDGDIVHLLCGKPGGPLNISLDDNEKTVLECLRFRRGIKNAMSIREIQERTKLEPRTIKQAVRDLRLNFHMPIASWKHAERGGYFLIVDEEDRAAWVKDVLDQVRGELSVLRAAAGAQAGLELLGQLRIEIEEGAHA